MNLVAIPFHDWKKCEREGFRTRDAHFLQAFGEHGLVDKLLVINRPISIAEILLYRRNWRVKQGKLLWKKGNCYLSQVGPKTYTLDIVVGEFIQPLRLKRHWVPYIFGQPMVLQAVTGALHYLAMDSSYALFLSAPLFVPLAEKLSPGVFVLDAQDNLLKHSLYADTPGLAAYYQYCQQRADLLFANSAETSQWLSQGLPPDHAGATHLSNGVDDRMFDPSRPYPVPADVAAIAQPRVGYAGKMQELFDVALMEQLIATMPAVNFVFIGQELNPQWTKSLWRYPNAHYLGDKAYPLLPAYLAAFDVAIIPYNVERQHGGDPIKFYEYLAMGKPIVTTHIGGVAAFQDYPQVCIAETAEQFTTGLAAFLDLLKEKRPIPTRPVPPEYLWQNKADTILKAVLARLKNSPASQTIAL
jgi:teichuronic acid biosynthesis glycosyltransferase TuaH